MVEYPPCVRKWSKYEEAIMHNNQMWLDSVEKGQGMAYWLKRDKFGTELLRKWHAEEFGLFLPRNAKSSKCLNGCPSWSHTHFRRYSASRLVDGQAREEYRNRSYKKIKEQILWFKTKVINTEVKRSLGISIKMQSTGFWWRFVKDRTA